MSDRNVAVRLTADINGYVSAMGQASQATRGVAKEAQAAGSQASSSFGSGLVTAAKAGATALTVTAAAATALGVSAFKTGVAYNALQQSSRAALTTILKSSQAANAQMDKLDAFAKNSPFAKQVFIRAQQQLLGFGLTAEKVIPAMDAIQNSVAAVGGSNDDIANVTDALAKMLGQGKLAGDTLNRLGMYGIDAAAIIGESMGKTGQEIRAMASKPGGIPAEDVWDALINGLQDRFGGAADNVKKTWVGATDRIKGAWRDIGSELAEAFVGHKGGGLAIEWVNKFADMLRAIQAQVKPLVDAIMPKLSGTFATITPLLEKATAAIKGMDPSKLAAGVERMAQVAPGIAAVSASILAMGGNSLGLSKLGMSLNPVVAGIVALVAASPEGRAAVAALMDALKPLADVALQLSGILLGSLTGGMQALGTVVQGIAPVVRLLADGVGLLADGFNALPGPVQAILGSLAAARVAMALLGTEAGMKVTAPLRDMASAFSESSSSLSGNLSAWGDLTRELREANPALSGVQARIEALSTSNGILGRMSDSFMNAAVQAKRFPNAAGAAAAAMTGLKGAASGLLNAIGGGWTLAIGAATFALTSWIQAKQEAKQRVEELTSAIKADSGVLGENTREYVANTIQKEGVASVYKKMGGNLQDLTRAAIGEADAIGRVSEVTARYREENERRLTQDGKVAAGAYQGAQANERLYGELDKVQGIIGRTNGEINKAADGYKIHAELLGDSAEGAQAAAVAQDAVNAALEAAKPKVEAMAAPTDTLSQLLFDLGIKSKETTDYLKALKGGLDMLGGGARAVEASQDALAASIDKAKEAAKEKASKTKTAAEVEREYRAALRGVADATTEAIQKQMDAGASQKELTTTYNTGRAALEKQIEKRGLHGKALKDEADRIMGTRGDFKLLLEEYAKTPPTVTTEVRLQGQQAALNGLQTVKNALDGVTGIFNTTVRTNYVTLGDKPKLPGSGVVTRAGGGAVFGPGTATSDSIPAWLSDGEFVVRTAAAQAIGYDRLHYANKHGRLPAFADGGRVGFATGGLASLTGADRSAIEALVRALKNPVNDLSSAARELRAAQSNVNRVSSSSQNRALASATASHKAAVDARDSLKARAVAAKKAADATKGVTVADREYRALQQQIAEANLRVTATSKAKSAAMDKAKDSSQKLKDAQQRLSEAQKTLAERQKAVADTARSMAESARSAYEIKGTDPRDWISIMTKGAGELGKFSGQINSLRGRGLSESLVQQIIGMGAQTGGYLSSQLLGKDSKTLIAQMNKSNSALEKAADKLGLIAATGVGRYAGGGAVYGKAGVDKNLALLSYGEHVLDGSDVSAMGGQAGVYAFRKALHTDPTRLRQAPVSVAPSLGSVSASFSDRDIARIAAAVAAQSVNLQASLVVDGRQAGRIVAAGNRANGR